jgi:hypothetical protein
MPNCFGMKDSERTAGGFEADFGAERSDENSRANALESGRDRVPHLWTDYGRTASHG